MAEFEPRPLSSALLEPLEAWFRKVPWHLRFPAVLEEHFESETEGLRRSWLFLCGWIGIFIFSSFSLTDPDMAPDSMAYSMKVRFLFIVPASILITTSFRLHLPPWLRELLQSILPLLALAGVLLILMASHHPNAGYYTIGSAYVVIYALTIARLRFPNALAVSFLTQLLFILSLPSIPSLPPSTHSYHAALILSGLVLGLVANHAQERSTRTSYLQHLLERLKREDLAQDNATLSLLAGTDPLTGIANRRSFDDFLAGHAANGNGCALVLMDIDHFKAYNDTYGHQAGDLCLQVFAGNLRLTLRSQDFVARVGGEEFAMVLPETDRDEALRVTERLRESFREFRLPHESSPTAAFLTFSAGIALCTDSCPPDRLYAHADAALYKAKDQGRDRWILETFSGQDETRTIFIP